MGAKRIAAEISKMRRKTLNSDGICLLPGNDDLYSWDAMILGPYNSEWEGGRFKLSVHFTLHYPFEPPHIKFVSQKIFHPKVCTNGEICMTILRNEWSPSLFLNLVLMCIQSVLCDPNPNAPANPEAARLYVENRREYYKLVEEIVE